MSKLTGWTYVLLGGAFLLILASVYILVTQAQSLKDSQAELANAKDDRPDP